MFWTPGYPIRCLPYYKAKGIHYYAATLNLRELQYFLAGGGDINVQDKHGMTLISWVIEKYPTLLTHGWTYDQILGFMLENGADLSLTNQIGLDVISQCILREADNILELFKSRKSLQSLPYLIFMQDLESIKSSIRSKEEANLIIGKVPLLQWGILSDSELIVNYLIDKGADLNYLTSYGYTALHLAIEKNKINMVNTLLKYRPELEIENFEGLTALHIASKSGDYQVAQSLILNGANVNARLSYYGYTPLYYSKSHELTNLLIKNGGKSKMYLWKKVFDITYQIFFSWNASDT
jgi:hypothetical protein